MHIIIKIFAHNKNGEYMKFKIVFLKNEKNENMISKKNYIGIYIFGIMIKKIYLDKNNNLNKKKNGNSNVITKVKNVLSSCKDIIKIISSVKLKKLDMQLGINLNDPILNAYAISFINSLVSIYIANNIKYINEKEVHYETFISEKFIYLNLNCIISIPLAKNIVSIIKIIFKNMKGGNKNGNKTSNRIFNDNINDFDRKYGRC